MARINVEDSLFKDIRFFQLAQMLGGMDAALGVMVRAWMLAQKWYLTPEKMIPMSEWEKQSLPLVVFDTGLAKVIDGKIRVSGIDEQFGWLLNCQNGGKAGGKGRPRNDEGIQIGLPNQPKRTLKGSKPLSLSPSLSLSQSSFSNTLNKNDLSFAKNESAEQSQSDKLTALPCYAAIADVIQERRISQNAQEKWTKAFPDSEWLCENVRKALAWEAAHPNRRKKNFTAFMTNWLTRDWDRRRIDVPMNRSEARSRANFEAAEQVKEIYRKQDAADE